MPDKRRRSDLDLFILALIDSGISTPYAFQQAAGLSQSATSPVLQRLLEAGLVRQGKPGTRGRIDYKVSAAGKRTLKEGWQPLITAGPSGNLVSDLRVALLVILGGGARHLAVDFLRQSAADKAGSVGLVERMTDASDVPPLARWYTDLRSQKIKALLNAESGAILAVANSCPEVYLLSRRATRPSSRREGVHEAVPKGRLGVVVQSNG